MAFGMCCHRKVLAGLATVGIAPGAALEVLPLILLAAFPLLLLAMMFAMRSAGSHGVDGCCSREDDTPFEARQARPVALWREEQRLERELSVSTVETRDAPVTTPVSTSPSPASA